MLNLFNRCLKANYKLTENGGSYSIEVDGNTLYILFECSREKEDWKNNFDFPKTPYKRMNEKWYAHRGFLRVWRSIRDEIECEVSNILFSSPSIENIICVGYSHGGALALFATEDMEYNHGIEYNVSGYGFGAPRVIWGIVPKSLKARLSRYTVIRNIPDIVTHLPPKIFGFRNVGKLIKLGKHFKYNPIKAHYSKSYKTELQAFTDV